ncbi:MAG TPA: M20/M25/M40 family metallo-hydrolase [Acidimicrobiia bacterium]|nr:M20/M25/M40 family metallo-hydrolase [Acidimicrobiia bacterium]
MIDRVGLLQALVRIDTTNPPGNERAGIDLIATHLAAGGIDFELVAAQPDRPNLIARIPGRGAAPPLLLQGHIDVVPVTGQRWARDPFGGDIAEGFIWGRGTLDMKGPVVMMLDALVRIASDPTPPAGDLIFAVVADEEMQGTVGARHLVSEHPQLFAGVRYALGEFGAFPFVFGDTRFYPIQIAERIGVGFELVIEGAGGHGSMPVRGGAMAKLGGILRALDRRRLPIHITPATAMMIQALVANTTGPTRIALQRLADARTAGTVLRGLSSRLGLFEPMFRNTVSPTVVRGGDAHNVIPERITLGLDGRMLPGISIEEFESEVRDVVGPDCQIRTITDGATSPAEPDLGLFPLLSAALVEQDPLAVPIPFLLPAVTDGRWFAQLGIQPYGYTPITLPPGFDFQRTVHAADERIPLEALEFGSEVLYTVLRRYEG